MNPNVNLIDVSHWTPESDDHLVRQICVNRGIALVTKLTQGVDYTDPTATQWMAPVPKGYFMYPGLYHFLDTSPYTAQWEHYWTQLKAQFAGRQILSVLDYEAGNPTASLSTALGFCNLHHAVTGHFPVLYGPRELIIPLADAIKAASGFTPVLWIAEYGNEPPEPWDIWQFGQRGSPLLSVWNGDVSTYRTGLKNADIWGPHQITVPSS
jgi:GH25 family lysozyme M1 (1,4-beta-N-acetylmuramidase)